MPSQRGLLFMTDDEMERHVEKALRAGYQVNIHAIGDAANHQVLDAFEHAYTAVGGRLLRNRIEHAQVVALSDIPRFKQLEIIASMQPTHATSDKNMAEDRIGPERLNGAYAWRKFLDQGTRVAGGSDFPVESDNPFFGLHAAVTRQDHDRPAAGRLASGAGDDTARGVPCLHGRCGLRRALGAIDWLARAGQVGRLHPNRPRPVQDRAEGDLEDPGRADLDRRPKSV